MQRSMKSFMILLLMASIALSGVESIHALSLQQQGIDELVSLSELILVGTVTEVSDGIENQIPYTQVTLEITETIRGDKRPQITFRQFGLREPRRMRDGRVNLNVTPEGWPTFEEGESVLLFLYRPARWTGLRTTVGLFQGKFNIKGGFASNAVNNVGLFDDVSVPTEKLTTAEQRLLAKNRGPIYADTFLSFVRKAVENHWFEPGG